MKTNKNLVNLMLMSIVATVTVSFTACSDDIIDDRNGDSLIIATEGEKLEAISFSPNDSSINFYFSMLFCH